MKIVLSPEIALKLETFARLYTKEFSGFGFVERDGETITVYDIVILDVGSEVFTEIPTQKILELMNRPDAAKMKLWLHKHPCQGWSGTDENTIKKTPLGGIPELVKWSASIVLTPNGWIGRVDSYKTGQMIVCEVEPGYHSWAKETLEQIIASKPKITAYQGSLLDDDWADWEEEEWEDVEDEEDLEDEDELEEVDQGTLPFGASVRNAILDKSSWWQRIVRR